MSINKIFQFLNNKRGSVMVESLIAMSLIVIGLLGLFNLISNSTSKAMEAVHKVQATYLAAEGIEVVKNILDTNYSRGSFEIISNAENLKRLSYNTTNGNSTQIDEIVFFDENKKTFLQTNQTANLSPTIFKRNIGIKNEGNYYSVSSTVKWKEENGKEFSVFLVASFYNWRPE